MSTLLLHNIRCLLTFKPLAEEQRGHSITESDMGLLRDAWIFCKDGKIVEVGSGTPPPAFQKADQIRDLQQAYVMPGLIDSHTHILFAGDRSQEFAKKRNGATYQDLAKEGGGIQATVRATRAASDATLTQLALERLQNFLREGVTTVEVKTGYGLSIEEELRHARLLKTLENQSPIHMVRTCLALHDASPEFESLEAYAFAVEKKLLPLLVKEDLVHFVDAFVERGYYTPESIQGVLQAAQKAGIGIRLHADEFSPSHGAECAAVWKAASADHLQAATESDAAALAKAGTVATLLPGTSLYSGLPFTDARKFFRAKGAVAIASDFNPGTSPFQNLSFLCTMGAIHCHLTLWEALASVTFVPALSLRLGKKKGALSKGFDADFLVYHSLKGPEHWLADMGQSKASEVWVKMDAKQT